MVDDLRIVPERDEIRPGAQKKVSGNKKPAKTRPQPPAKSGNSALVFVLCVMVIAVSGVAAYLYFQTQTLSEQRAELDKRVEVLEGKLSVTDESLSESGAAIQTVLKDHSEQIDLHMSEIRKLWGVSYDTNRIKIQELEKTQANNTAKINAARDSLKKVENLPTSFTTLKSQVDSTANQSLAVSATLDEIEASMDGLSKIVSGLKSDLRAQQRTVAENKEAIEAIDQYRIQINQKVLRLEQQVGVTP